MKRETNKKQKVGEWRPRTAVGAVETTAHPLITSLPMSLNVSLSLPLSLGDAGLNLVNGIYRESV